MVLIRVTQSARITSGPRHPLFRAGMLQNLAKCSFTRHATANVVFGSAPLLLARRGGSMRPGWMNVSPTSSKNVRHLTSVLRHPLLSSFWPSTVALLVLMDRWREGEILCKKYAQDSIVQNGRRRHWEIGLRDSAWRWPQGRMSYSRHVTICRVGGWICVCPIDQWCRARYQVPG